MGGDAWQGLPADVAEGGSGVRAGVPVVHPGEVLHVELAGLRRGGENKKRVEHQVLNHSIWSWVNK